MKMYHYGTNVIGSQWYKTYGASWSKLIPNWKSTTYSILFQEICNCCGIITTSFPVTSDIITKYNLVVLTEEQEKLVDSFINFNPERKGVLKNENTI
jgi:hypothetical protein